MPLSPPRPAPTRFLTELSQMPAALDRLISYYEQDGRARLDDFRARAAGASEIVASGMGTSRFAPEAIFPRLARRGVSCRTVDAGEWLHYGTGAPSATSLVILTSQSGESVEVKRLVQEGRVASGFVAITNEQTSTLARAAGIAFPLLAGDEASISTKTYANTLAVLHLLAAALEGPDAVERGLRELRAAARLLEDAPESAVMAAARAIASGPGIAFVGRGPAYVAARQCALTFMEGARCLTSAFTGGAFNHGPAETVDSGFPLVIFQATGRTRRLSETLARRASTHGASVVVLTDESSAPIPGVAMVDVPRLRHAQDAEELFPLLVCRVQNLLLHHVAAERGHEAGIFRYGEKVTAHE